MSKCFATCVSKSNRGDLPKLDHAIFADTGWEPAAVYKQLDMLTRLAEEAGINEQRPRWVAKGDPAVSY